MSEINVVSRTQRIIVDPASSSVSVINAGPQGPGGPAGAPGGVTLEEVRDDLATVLVPGANITIVPNDVANTITIASTATGTGSGTEVNVGPTPPSPLVEKSLWVDDTDFTTYLIYNNGTDISPVQIATPFGGTGGGGEGFGNIDGGGPSTVFGGTDPVDGGAP
jgi:hypothetical protein